jgi:hypothetical protein
MPRDIEEFLKMAAKRRQQQKKQGGQPSPSAARSQPARRPAASHPPARPENVRPATDDEIVIIGGTESPHDPYQQSVAEHVRSHIDTSNLARHATQLGEEVALADDKMDARLHSKFDHAVGRLSLDASRSVQSTTTTTTARAVSPLAQELLEMLSNPASIRQAILISEVLRRPDVDFGNR